MTIDHTKFDYYEVHPTNRKLLARTGKGDTQLEYGVEKHMAALVHKISLRNPNWVFVGNAYGRSSEGDRLLFGFRMYDDKEDLGIVRVEFNNHGVPTYLMDNPRLVRERKKGNFTRTIDANKALKIISKNFGGKRTDELVNEALSSVKSQISVIDHVAKTKKDRLFYRDAPYFLEQHIMANWETMRPILIAAGMSIERVDEMPVRYEAAYHAKVMCNALHTDAGSLVLIRGDDYIVTCECDGRTGPQATKIYSTDTLPTALKRGIACLKMAEMDMFIHGVGIRFKPDTYFVLAKMEEQND